MEPDEKKALSLLQQIQAISRDKDAKRKEAKQARKVERAKKLAKCVVAFPILLVPSLTISCLQGGREAGRAREEGEAGVLRGAGSGREAQGRGRALCQQEEEARVGVDGSCEWNQQPSIACRGLLEVLARELPGVSRSADGRTSHRRIAPIVQHKMRCTATYTGKSHHGSTSNYREASVSVQVSAPQRGPTETHETVLLPSL